MPLHPGDLQHRAADLGLDPVCLVHRDLRRTTDSGWWRCQALILAMSIACAYASITPSMKTAGQPRSKIIVLRVRRGFSGASGSLSMGAKRSIRDLLYQSVYWISSLY